MWGRRFLRFRVVALPFRKLSTAKHPIYQHPAPATTPVTDEEVNLVSDPDRPGASWNSRLEKVRDWRNISSSFTRFFVSVCMCIVAPSPATTSALSLPPTAVEANESPTAHASLSTALLACATVLRHRMIVISHPSLSCRSEHLLTSVPPRDGNGRI